MSDLDQELTAGLRERGQRATSQRLVIHRVLRELAGHVTAEVVLTTVADLLPGVSLPTIDATLELFEELRLVRRVAVPGGPTLHDPRTAPHHHLICQVCGARRTWRSHVDLAPAIRAAARAGFDAGHAEVLVTGVCEACAKARAAPRAGRRPRS